MQYQTWAYREVTPRSQEIAGAFACMACPEVLLPMVNRLIENVWSGCEVFANSAMSLCFATILADASVEKGCL